MLPPNSSAADKLLPSINNSETPTSHQLQKMKFVILCLVVLAVVQIDAAPQFLGGFFPRPSGSGAGFGTGQAGPGGVSSTGVAVANAQNGGFSSSNGFGTASSGLFGFNANGQGSSNSFGK